MLGTFVPLSIHPRHFPTLVGSTCDSAAADQVCVGEEESWGASKVGVEQNSRPLTQLIQQPGIWLVHHAILSQLGEKRVQTEVGWVGVLNKWQSQKKVGLCVFVGLSAFHPPLQLGGQSGLQTFHEACVVTVVPGNHRQLMLQPIRDNRKRKRNVVVVLLQGLQSFYFILRYYAIL